MLIYLDKYIHRYVDQEKAEIKCWWIFSDYLGHGIFTDV